MKHEVKVNDLIIIKWEGLSDEIVLKIKKMSSSPWFTLQETDITIKLCANCEDSVYDDGTCSDFCSRACSDEYEEAANPRIDP